MGNILIIWVIYFSQHIEGIRSCFRADFVFVVVVSISMNRATKVVAAIHDITYPWEAFYDVTVLYLSSDICFGVAINICIAGTTEGIVDTSIT